MTTYATSNDPTKSTDTKAGKAAEPTMDELSNLKEDLAALRDDVKSLAHTATRDAKGMASEQFDRVSHAAGDMADNVRLHAEEYTHSVQDKIREKPISAVLISVAVGAILAKVVLR